MASRTLADPKGYSRRDGACPLRRRRLRNTRAARALLSSLFVLKPLLEVKVIMRVKTTSGPRSRFFPLLIAVLGGIAAFLILFLVGYGFFLSLLLMLVVFAAGGAVHYALWGRQEERETHAHFDNAKAFPKR